MSAFKKIATVVGGTTFVGGLAHASLCPRIQDHCPLYQDSNIANPKNIQSMKAWCPWNTPQKKPNGVPSYDNFRLPNKKKTD